MIPNSKTLGSPQLQKFSGNASYPSEFRSRNVWHEIIDWGMIPWPASKYYLFLNPFPLGFVALYVIFALFSSFRCTLWGGYRNENLGQETTNKKKKRAILSWRRNQVYVFFGKPGCGFYSGMNWIGFTLILHNKFYTVVSDKTRGSYIPNPSPLPSPKKGKHTVFYNLQWRTCRKSITPG